jgi:hypothetical protein
MLHKAGIEPINTAVENDAEGDILVWIRIIVRNNFGDERFIDRERYDVLLLLVEGLYSPMYWMHLDITANTTLTTLDQFLRDIWLECCGHLSAFTIAGTCYSVDEAIYEWDTRQKNMRVPLHEVLRPGQTCSYEYDFGSTTELTLKVIAEREATGEGKAIHVLARNSLSFVPCDECGEAPAILTCARCVYHDAGWLCKDCAEKHDCGQEMLRPRVNSPREGVCGYTGPNPAFSW